jgi:hypothetical protein
MAEREREGAASPYPSQLVIAIRHTYWVIAAACGGTATSPVKPVEPVRDVWIHKKLSAGTKPGHAHRATFELAFDGDHATLVETDEQAPRATLEETERASWEVRSARTYTGMRRREAGAMMLDLESPGVQPLHLRCTTEQLQVAAAGARRVPSGQGGECGSDKGRWEPAALVAVEALVCGEAIQPAAGDHDDDDRLVFGRTPGIEWASVNNGCELDGGGLRRAR